MAISSVNRARPATQVTNVKMGKPEIVGPETPQARKLLAEVAAQVSQFNQTPIEKKLGMGSLHTLMSNSGATKSSTAA